MNRSLLFAVIVVVVAAACIAVRFTGTLESTPSPSAPPPADITDAAFHFIDTAPQAGIDFRYFRGETGEFWITETTGGGVALIDFDCDGWLDIWVANGCRQPPDPADREHTCRLFRNQRDGTFCDVTNMAGVAHAGYGQGCYGFDYDNDGFDDAFLTCWGPNMLFQNNGDGTFRVTTLGAVPDEDAWSTGAVASDFDRDGLVDLFVVKYLQFDYRNQPQCGDPRTGERSYCGPDSFPVTRSLMWRNRGDGTFEEISRSSGMTLPDGRARPHAKGLGAVATDVDDDGWLDIYVANDLKPNFLFLNRSESAAGMRFDESALLKGVATNRDGAAQDSMGIACGDYDGDGRLDLLVTNFYLEGVTLYRNLGAPGFQDVTRDTALLGPTRSVLGWGTGFIDFDNDGWLDLFTSNGHVQSKPEPGVPYAMPAQIFRNRAGERFEEMGQTSGEYFRDNWNGRGTAFGDLDNDGKTDVVVVHHHQPMAILRNSSENSNQWIRLIFLGRKSDRGALGTRVRLTMAGSGADATARPLLRELGRAGSYLSSNDHRMLIGYGPHRALESLEIRWPSGAIQLLGGLGTNGEVIVREP